MLYLHRQREAALVQFRHQQLAYLQSDGKHPPTFPPILVNVEEE